MSAEARPPLPERRAPTHVLVLEVPLHIDEGQTFYFDPLADALNLVLALSRVATIGVLCDGPRASIQPSWWWEQERGASG